MVEYIISTLIALLAGLFCGYRLGRNVSVGGAGGYDSQAPSSRPTDVKDTVERTIQANADAEATIARMRDIVNRHRGIANNSAGQGETE